MIDKLLYLGGLAGWITPTRSFFGWLIYGRKTVSCDVPPMWTAAMIKRGLEDHGVKVYYGMIINDEYVFSVDRQHYANIYTTLHTVLSNNPTKYSSCLLDSIKMLFWIVMLAVVLYTVPWWYAVLDYAFALFGL